VIIAGWLGVGDVVTSESAAEIVNAVVTLVGLITAIYGRMTAQGPTTLLGFRKK
jgi:uncharacterized membrane protein